MATVGFYPVEHFYGVLYGYLDRETDRSITRIHRDFLGRLPRGDCSRLSGRILPIGPIAAFYGRADGVVARKIQGSSLHAQTARV